MVTARTLKGAQVYVTFYPDCEENVGGYYCQVYRRRGNSPWMPPPTPNPNILAQRMSGKSVTFASWQRNIPHSTTRH